MTQSTGLRRVGILFSGGPAPGANAVISAAALSFLDQGYEVVGFFHGYSNLVNYDAAAGPLKADIHYRLFKSEDLRGKRNERGIMIGTSRMGPGASIQDPDDLLDPSKTQGLDRVHRALTDLDIDALVSIGGDGTLRTANHLYLWQQQLPPERKRIRVVHVPKTIDNDYQGIDFTFGYFTAVEVMAREIQNLCADARATSSYFVAETMGRRAGWLAYGAAIAGEAHLVIGLEDMADSTGEGLKPEHVIDHIVDWVVRREHAGRHDGVVVIAEGIGEALVPLLPDSSARDEQGRVDHGRLDLAKWVSAQVAKNYGDRMGRPKKIRGIKLGYESRSAPPHTFDVMLGSQLGIGAYRALVEENLDGHMISVKGQLELRFVPFTDVIHAETMRTEAQLIRPESDFFRLARFLEARAEPRRTFTPGRRRER